MSADELFHFLVVNWITPLAIGIPVNRAFENSPPDAQHYLTLDTYTDWTKIGQSEKGGIGAGDFQGRTTQHECTVGIWEVGSPDGIGGDHACGDIANLLLDSTDLQWVNQIFAKYGLAVRRGEDPVMVPDLKGQQYNVQFHASIVVGLSRTTFDLGLATIQSMQVQLSGESSRPPQTILIAQP